MLLPRLISSEEKGWVDVDLLDDMMGIKESG